MAASLSTAASTSTAGSPNYDVLGTFASYLYGRIRSSLDQKELQEGKILTFSNRRQQTGKLQAVRIVGLGGVGKAISFDGLFKPKNSHQSRSCFLSDIRGKWLFTSFAEQIC